MAWTRKDASILSVGGERYVPTIPTRQADACATVERLGN